MTKEFPQGKFMATVKIGPKGQIVIPKEVRDMFGWEPGESVLLLADKTQGVALQPFAYAETFFAAVQRIKKEDE